jgi:sulfoxide reductase heme-binding subunit YedZ
MIDAKNTLRQHLIVGIFSLGLVFIFKFLLDISWSMSFARVSFILLFLVLIIGPIMRLKKYSQDSSSQFILVSWRGELGIWFALTALTHFIIVLMGSSLSDLISLGGEGYGLANLLGLVALFLTLLLAATSFGKAIEFLGVDLWKWLHKMVYVIFYLVSGHFIYFQFFSTHKGIGTDWFGYIAIVMVGIIIVLQLVTFLLKIVKYRKNNSM